MNKLALLIFLLLHGGLILELILIGHYSSFWQYIPIGVLLLGLLSLIEFGGSIYVGKAIYSLIMISGVLGVYLHLKNNWHFEMEMYPSMGVGLLIKKSLTGALPVLAPGTLVPIGLMGFLLMQLKSKN